MLSLLFAKSVTVTASIYTKTNIRPRFIRKLVSGVSLTYRSDDGNSCLFFVI
jgi:hypothetical protein